MAPKIKETVPSSIPAEAETSLCPACGWPLEGEPNGRCPQCGHPAGEQSAVDLLARLGIEAPPRVVECEPAPDHWFRPDTFDSAEMYHLRLQAEQLGVTSGFDRLICLDDISVDHYQHQLEAALGALRDMRGRALLADEVGLGKTIEAGIVMKELIERGLIRRVLILTPASLTWQWREEMETKFHEPFTVLERLKQLPAEEDEAAARGCRWIISLDRAKNNRWAKRLLAYEYDLLIVDEAHKLKNHRTQAHRFVNRIRKRYVLMLTATPVHNNLMELYNLITILRPGHLGTRRAFRQNFMDTTPAPGRRRPVRRTVYSNPGATPLDYLGKSYQKRLAHRQNRNDVSWILRRTEAFSELDHLPYLNPAGQKAVLEVKQLLEQGYEVYDFEAVEYMRWGLLSGLLRKGRRTDFVCRLKLNASPDRSERRSTPRNPAALRALLREVMIRNRRSRVAVRFPPRQAHTYPVKLAPPERRLYEDLTTYIREELRKEAAGAGSRRRGPLQMILMTLQKELCSSPQAVARTLRKMVDRRPDPQLAEQLVLAWGIKQGRKVEMTLSILEQHPGKFLIFTDYRPTMDALAEALQEAGHETVLFHGGLTALERVEAVRAFRKSARVMVSTRSGSEGANLQFCHQMINFDLPWNPMRIEQRVGRLHRLGQKQVVTIFNLAAADTIEAYVLDLLAHKIRMFELVIGELDMILGELGDERGFERYIEEAWASSRSEAELTQMLAELEKILDQAQQSYQDIRAASDELSDLIDAFDEVIR